MAVSDVILLLEYNQGLIPAGGTQTFASSAAPVKQVGKDAAGHRFHNYALLQRGVISAFCLSMQRMKHPTLV